MGHAQSTTSTTEPWKLEPRMVPAPLWGIALRTSLKGRWLPEVSRPVRNHAGVCALCGGRGDCRRSRWRLCCDEVWSYADADPVVSSVITVVGDDLARLEAIQEHVPTIAYRVLPAPPVARLVDLQALCWNCNAIIHYGHTETESRKRGGWPMMKAVLEHGARVNGVHPDAMVQRVYEAKAAWLIRSHVPGWTISWDGWEGLRDKRSGQECGG